MFATCMEGVDGWINGINGWMDGWRGGWMNWWMEKLMIRTEKLYFKLQISYQEELHGSWNQRAEGLRCVFLPEVTTCPVSLLLLWWGYWFGWPLFLTLELKKERFIRISLRFLVSPILLGFMDYNVSTVFTLEQSWPSSTFYGETIAFQLYLKISWIWFKCALNDSFWNIQHFTEEGKHTAH